MPCQASQWQIYGKNLDLLSPGLSHIQLAILLYYEEFSNSVLCEYAHF